MSIAIDTRRVRTRTNEVVALHRVAPSREAQLQASRGMLRHFVLAFAATATILYAIAAMGLTI